MAPEHPALPPLEHLLQPSIEQAPPATKVKAPFEPSSLLYPAFFGGAFATLIASWVQLHRLVPKPREATQVYTIMGGTALLYVLAIVGGMAMFNFEDKDIRRGVRLSGQIIAVLGQVLVNRALTKADRRFDATHSEGRASLWLPGLAMIGGGWLFGTFIIGLVAHMVGAL